MNKDLLSDELIAKVLDLRRKKKSTSAYIMQKCNCTKEEARQLIASIDKGIEPNEQEVESSLDQIANNNILKFGDYTYNQLTDKYIVPLTTYGRDYVCPGDQHRAMLTAYSNWKGSEQSIQEIGRVYKMRKEWVREYFQKMGWTHDTVPITDEELVQNKGNEAIRRVLQTKRTAIQQELQHQDWKQTQNDAEQWRLFEAGKLSPFTRVLDSWTPPKLPSLKLPVFKKIKKNIFVATLSDLHIGQRALSSELTKGADYNAEIVARVIDDYSVKIIKDVADRSYSFEKCVIISAGDILHSLTGETEKGTVLQCDILGEAQFELALNCLHRFITRMLEIFGTVEVHSTKGNHSAADWILFKTLECAFNANSNIVFNNYKSRTSIFRIKNTAILLDHGESDYIKAKVPTSDIGRESYVQNKFLELGEKLGTGIKSRVFFQGDKHHFEQSEFRGFEFIMLSSCVLGDKYSDHLGLHSRPRQNCFVINDDGIKEALHYYLD